MVVLFCAGGGRAIREVFHTREGVSMSKGRPFLVSDERGRGRLVFVGTTVTLEMEMAVRKARSSPRQKEYREGSDEPFSR